MCTYFMPNGKNEFANKSANGLDNVNCDYCTVLQDLEVFGDTILHGDTTVDGTLTAGSIVGPSGTITDLHVLNNAQIDGDTTVNGDVLIKTNLTVWGSTTDTGAVNVTDSIDGYLNGEQVHNTNSGTNAAAAFKAYNDTNDQGFFGITSSGNTGPHGAKRTFVEGPGLDISTTGGASKTVRFLTNDTNRCEIGDTEVTSHVPITIPADPTTSTQVANKNYVDAAVSGLGAISSLTGDVTATGPGAAAATVAAIQGTTVSGTTGTGNVVFSAAPTLTGVPSLSTANATTLGITQATGNTLNVLSTGTSVSSTTGAVTVAGGVGINDNLNVLNGISGRTMTSTVATGTAPLTVASTTQVPNLYSSRAALADNVTNSSVDFAGTPFTTKGVVYSSDLNTITSTLAGASGQVLVADGTGTPSWSTNISGQSGSTALSSVDYSGTPFTTGGVVTASDTNTITSTNAGIAGQVLVSNGTGVAPTFQYSGAALPDFGNYSTNSTVVFTTSPANATAGDNYKATATYSFYLSTDPGTTPASGAVYASQDTYTFVLSTAGSAVIGSVYSNNGNQFIVSATVTSSSSIVMYGLGFAFPQSSGTLTLVSGSGDATINFSSNSITTPGHNFVTVSYDTVANILYMTSAYDPLEINGILNKVTSTGSQTIPYEGFTRPDLLYFEVSTTITGGTTLTTIGSGAPLASGYLVKDTGNVGSDDVITYGTRTVVALQLTASSPTTIYSSVTKQFNLPDATTLQPGRSFIFAGSFNVVFGNEATVSIYAYGDTAYIIPLYSFSNTHDALFRATLLENTTSAGNWAFTYEASGSRGPVAYEYDLNAQSVALKSFEFLQDIYNALNDSSLSTLSAAVAADTTAIGTITAQLNTALLLTNTVVLWNGSKFISLDGTEDGSLLTYKSGTDAPQYGGKAVITDSDNTDVILGIANNFVGTCDALVAKAPLITGGDSVSSYFGQGISSANCLELLYSHMAANDPANFARLIMGNTVITMNTDSIISEVNGYYDVETSGTRSLVVGNDSTAGNVDLGEFYMPAMTSGSSVNLKLGKNTGNGNYTHIKQFYNTDDSSSNYSQWSTGLADKVAIKLINTNIPLIETSGAVTIVNSDATTDSLVAENTAASSAINLASFVAPNSTGGTMHMNVGVNALPDNHGKIGFVYTGNGSPANSLYTEMGLSRIEQFGTGANVVTGATTINSANGSVDSLVVTNQETSSVDIEMATFSATNITSGHVTTIKLGKNAASNNYGVVGFQYSGTGSPSNGLYYACGGSETLLQADGTITNTGIAFNDFNSTVATGSSVKHKVGLGSGALDSANYSFVNQAGSGQGTNHALLGVSDYESLRLLPRSGVTLMGTQTMGTFHSPGAEVRDAAASSSKTTGSIVTKNRYTFTITAATVLLGDVYTNNGLFFTAIATSAGTTAVFVSVGDPVTNPPDGVLTRTVGTGASSLTFSSWSRIDGGIGVDGAINANQLNTINEDPGASIPVVSNLFATQIGDTHSAVVKFGKGTSPSFDDYAQLRFYIDGLTNNVLFIENGNSAIGVNRSGNNFITSLPVTTGTCGFTINNTDVGTTVDVYDALAANVPVGGNVTSYFGKNTGTGNKVLSNFFYNGANDVGNYYRIALDNGAELYLNNTTIPQVAALGQFSITNNSQPTPTLKAHNVSSSAGDIEIAELMADNVNNGNFVNFKMGKDTGTGNHGDIEFFSNGNNDAANRFTFGMGSAGLAVNNAGENALSGKTTVTASGASSFIVNNNASNIDANIGEFYQPNMVATTDIASIRLGKSSTSGDHTQLSFTYNADSTNHAALTCGSSDFTLSSGGLSVLTSSLLTTNAKLSQVANLGGGTKVIANFFNAGTVPVTNKVQIGYDDNPAPGSNACVEIAHYADNVSAANDYATIGLLTQTPAIKINPGDLKFQQPVKFPNSSYTTNGVVYASDTVSLASTAVGGAGQVLTSNGGGTPPSWTTVTGTGTVTSVSATVPSILSVNVTNPTTTPAIAITTATTPTGSNAIVLATNPTIDGPTISNTLTLSGSQTNLSVATNYFIDSTNASPANINIGYNTVKPAAEAYRFAIYDNSTNRVNLLSGFTSGTGSGTSHLTSAVPFNSTGAITSTQHCTFGNLPPAQTIYTSGSGTYTTPANCKYIIFTLVGGGAGGSGADSTSVAGGGGGGGGWAKHKIDSPASSYTYSVGAGGAGGSGATAGTAGGDTSFDGTTYKAKGGGVGGYYVGGSGGGTQVGASLGGGGGGGGCVHPIFGGTTALSGYGGSSLFGGTTKGLGSGVDSNGNAGVSIGSGGSGAVAVTVGPNYTGGAGAGGIVIVDAYFI